VVFALNLFQQIGGFLFLVLGVRSRLKFFCDLLVPSVSLFGDPRVEVLDSEIFVSAFLCELGAASEFC